MQTIYCVWAAHGSYDDYYNNIQKAFFHKDEAEDFKTDYNEQLHVDAEQAQICEKCMARFYETNITKLESQQKFIDKIKKECDIADISFYDGDINCKNELSIYLVHERHEATIQELKVN